MIDDLVQSAGMGGGRTPPIGSRSRRHEPVVKLLAPGAPAAEEQAAAVCYRIQNARIEFLLVRTRKRRWTFPKGGVDPGLSPAEAASQEAWEEAGVQGLIDETAFAQYVLGKQGDFGEGAERGSQFTLTFVKSCNSTNRRNPIAVQPGSLPSRRSGG